MKQPTSTGAAAPRQRSAGTTRRILLRSRKTPFDVATPEQTLAADLIGSNSGNLVFSHAAYRILLTENTEIASTEGRIGSPHEAGEINEKYDVFVVPLANAFRRTFEENLIKLTSLIKRLKIPVVVLGVGCQSNVNYDLEYPKPIEASVKAFVRAVLDRSPSIGVRGEFTHRYLQSLGFRDVDIIGCPSMFMHGEGLHVEKRLPWLTSDARLAINVSPYVKAMGNIVMSHHARYPNLTYIPQDLKTLELLLWGAQPADQGKTSPLPIYASHPLYRENKIRFFVDPPTWMSYLAECDFAFGTRIHGNITALISGTPAYVFAHDARTRELVEYFEIPHRKMTDVPADIDAADLYEEADYSGLNNGHKARLATFVAFLEKHRLDHVFVEGDGGTRFDDRIGKLAYPSGVGPMLGTSPAELLQRLRWLKDSNDELRQAAVEMTQSRDLLRAALRRMKGLYHRL